MRSGTDPAAGSKKLGRVGQASVGGRAGQLSHEAAFTRGLSRGKHQRERWCEGALRGGWRRGRDRSRDRRWLGGRSRRGGTGDEVAVRRGTPGAPATIGEEVRRHPEAAQALENAEPSILTGVALTVAAGVVVLGGLAVGVLLLMVRREVGFARWDLSAASWGAEHASDVSSEFLRNVSLIGGTVGSS